MYMAKQVRRVQTGKGASAGGWKGYEITEKERGGQEMHQRGEGPAGPAHCYPGMSFCLPLVVLMGPPIYHIFPSDN